MVVGTRNTSMEVPVDGSIKNWVIQHVDEKLDSMATNLNNVMTQIQYLVTDVNRLKTREGSSRFSRLGKLEFPKFSGDDVQGWLYIVQQFFAVDEVADDEKVKVVSIHLYDRALIWHLQ